MKNKILLTVVFASLGFAIYALLSNLQRPQYKMYYYEGTSVASVKNYSSISKAETAAAARKKYEKETSSEKSSVSSPFNVRKKEEPNSSDYSSMPETAFENQQSKNGKSRHSDLSVNTDMASSGILLTVSDNGHRSRNIAENISSLSSVSNFSSAVTTPPGTFMGAPTATNDDIIIDPGGDPDPIDIIPVGEGQTLLIILALGYGLFITLKRKH